jgi:hypothetical protein
VAGLVVGVFGWAVTVLGIALAAAQEGADQWWLVLVFGLAILALVLGAGYLLATRLLGRTARPPVSEPGRRPDAAGVVESASWRRAAAWRRSLEPATCACSPSATRNQPPKPAGLAGWPMPASRRAT